MQMEVELLEVKEKGYGVTKCCCGISALQYMLVNVT
jgi:hypothetical protein